MAKINIMIVEDEFIIANDLAMMLERLGYFVCGIAKNYQKAVAILEEQKPDLIMLDINLGAGPDGFELARHIGSEYKIPFIFATSYSDQKTVLEAKISLPNGYLLKPFSQEDIYVAVEMALTN